MLKLRAIIYFLSRPSSWTTGLSLYVLISAAAHAIILGAFILSPGSGKPQPDTSPITVYIKPEAISVDFEPDRINPADFKVEPLEPEKFPEITILGDNAPALSQPDKPADATASDYSTEARPILDGSNKLPPYPRLARQLGQEGLVVLSVEINAKGLAQDVKIAKSSGYKLLDDAAVKTVRGWIFIPATKKGRPVPSKVEIPVRFKLT
ncbi:MAG: energy transducer TonB [Planctomycetes bacterium]|nr:energy transducer TonB [Planctomycetota bacterium]